MPSLGDGDFYYYRNFYRDQPPQMVQVFYKSLHVVSFSLNIIFLIIFMISLDAVKTTSKLEKIEPKNKVIPVQIQPKYENKIESRQWFWQSA